MVGSMAAGVAYAVFSSWELLPTGVPPTVAEAVLYLEVSAATALAVTLAAAWEARHAQVLDHYSSLGP